MLKQHGLHFGQGHISVVSLTVFIVPRGNGKSMELTCPIQCTYRLTEVTVRKDLAQQSTQKTLKGPQGRFQLNGDMAHQYFHLNCIASGNETGSKNFYIKAKCTQVDQRYRSDNVSSLISFIFSVSAAAASCCTVSHAIDLTVAKDTSCTLKDCYTKR